MELLLLLLHIKGSLNFFIHSLNKLSFKAFLLHLLVRIYDNSVVAIQIHDVCKKT